VTTGLRLEGLAASLPQRWSVGRRKVPQSAEALFEALLARETGGWTLLDWLHVLRHKNRWDVAHASQADLSAEMIWRAAAQDVALRGQVLGRMIEGLCGGEGLAPSMVAACARIRPLASTEPLLQDIIAALAVVDREPQQVVALCMEHNRAPRALMARVGLPTDLSLLDHVEASIPGVMREHAREPAQARLAAQWLLMSLREAAESTQDRIAVGLLAELSATEAHALPDLCWWLGEIYGPEAPNSRWRVLSASAQKALRGWL